MEIQMFKRLLNCIIKRIKFSIALPFILVSGILILLILISIFIAVFLTSISDWIIYRKFLFKNRLQRFNNTLSDIVKEVIHG